MAKKIYDEAQILDFSSLTEQEHYELTEHSIPGIVKEAGDTGLPTWSTSDLLWKEGGDFVKDEIEHAIKDLDVKGGEWANIEIICKAKNYETNLALCELRSVEDKKTYAMMNLPLDGAEDLIKYALHEIEHVYGYGPTGHVKYLEFDL